MEASWKSTGLELTEVISVSDDSEASLPPSVHRDDVDESDGEDEPTTENAGIQDGVAEVVKDKNQEGGGEVVGSEDAVRDTESQLW